MQAEEAQEKRDHRAQIGERAHDGRKPNLLREYVHRSGILGQAGRLAPKRQHFRVGAKEKEKAGQDRAPFHRARNAGERVSRFRTQRRRAFKSHRS